jgi:hypothetical protein
MRLYGSRILCAGTALVAGAALLSGCGLGPQSEPQALPARAVPYGLLFSQAPRATPVQPGLPAAEAKVYLEGNDQRLVGLETPVRYPATVRSALGALARGPTASQSERGFVSPASAVGPFGVGPVRRGVLTVELPVSFENLSGEDETVAAAQIVFTVTGFPGIKGVVFRLGGQAAQVPNDQGKLVMGPLTRRDYWALAS